MGVSPRDFQQMQQRLAAPRRTARPAVTPTLGGPALAAASMVLGVDPSLRGTGYGVIRTGRGGPKAVVHGVIHCPQAWDRSRCLLRIAEALREVAREHRPGVCVIESLFYAQNYQTALIMGEARGACLVAVAEAGMTVYEMAPRRVKQAIVGYGAAQKLAVAKMVQRLLGLAEVPPGDAADALALAIAYVQEQGRYSLSPPKRL
jgi:crossover junction endodeoxyribonuclease RuvC